MVLNECRVAPKSIVQKSLDCFDYFLTKDIDFSKFDQTNTAKLDIQTEASDLLCFATYYIEKEIIKYILETTNADINFANSLSGFFVENIYSIKLWKLSQTSRSLTILRLLSLATFFLLKIWKFG